MARKEGKNKIPKKKKRIKFLLFLVCLSFWGGVVGGGVQDLTV